MERLGYSLALRHQLLWFNQLGMVPTNACATFLDAVRTYYHTTILAIIDGIYLGTYPPLVALVHPIYYVAHLPQTCTWVAQCACLELCTSLASPALSHTPSKMECAVLGTYAWCSRPIKLLEFFHPSHHRKHCKLLSMHALPLCLMPQ